MIVTTSAGDSENGMVPVEFVAKDTFTAQLGVELVNFKRGKQTLSILIKYSIP
ncbi:hypothetical protein FORC13_p051 (plasmid) [Bacillus cereus]|uniref:hypothetical protein n=1 Tax=Bacillus cereus group TaxID=86661 RepID=UPI000744997F|nr:MULTISPECIES: hypothetical protein [Bacillus cereus group]ALZ64536.1 hypothetical protein FORC13_p051 [Bacillus cereus]MEC2394246.1 hypothetical protein [Bacillus toyonensis]